MKRPPTSRSAGLRRAGRGHEEDAMDFEKKIAYVAMEAPARVEWYVGEEVRALRERGVDVVLCGVKRPRWEELDGAERNAARETTYFRPWKWGKLARAAWMCVRKWRELEPIYRRVVMGGEESLARRVKGMVHTWMGVYFALLLEGRGVQHIHAHHGYFAAWAAMVAARMLGITYSVTLHGSDLLVDRVFLDEKVKRAEVVFTVSDYNREFLLKRYAVVEAGRVVVRKMGICVAHVKRDQAGQERCAERLEIVAVGRLVAVKDFGFLVRACAMLKARGVKVRCRIAGEGPKGDRLERQIEEMELEREVELVGSVGRDVVQRLYDEADIVALTSKSEGIPLVLMEAMARGAIVLAPQITGIPELVRDGETGFLYRAGDLDDFLARVEWIRRWLPELSEVRRQARKFVREHFDAEKNTAEFCGELLRRLGWSAVEEATAHDEDPVLQQV